jgi:protein-disulfide isomerase
MKKLFAVVVAASLIVVVGACCSKKKEAPAETGSAAMVGTTPITMAELNEKSKDALQRVDMEIYQVKRRVLDQMIEDKIIDEAAKAAGKGKEDYIKEEVDIKVQDPTEEEIKAMYDARKDSYKQPFDNVKDQIANFLKQNRKNQAYRAMVASLREKAAVKVFLEPPRVEIDVSGLPAIGDKDAPVTMIEFSDYQCPFCKRVRPTIWKLTDQYKGKLKYVFVDFPLSFHQYAKKAHEAARCAGDQDKYYDYNKKIFENQQTLDVKDLKRYAKEIGLKTSDFDKCLDSGKNSALVDELQLKGMDAGVSGTPAYFINGIMLSGARPYKAFTEVIDSELSR